jgi:transcriptional regulator with XRE-family HTH domain
MAKINQVKSLIDDCVGVYGSVTELAKILNVSRGSVSRWRNGKNMPSADFLLKLQKIHLARVKK